MRLLPPRWPLAAQVRQRSELLDRVIQALGANPASLVRKDGGKAFAEARVTCLDCRYGRACQNWLDAADGLPLPAHFCPNASFFLQLMSATTADEAFDKGQRRPVEG